MKKILTIASVLMVSVSSLFAAISQPAATVNLIRTKVITTDELNAQVKNYQDAYTQQGQDPTQVSPLQVLQTMINNELVLQGAEKEKISITESQVDSAYNQYMSNMGMTADQFVQAINQNYGSVADFRSELKNQLVIQQYVTTKEAAIINAPVAVSESEISTTYRKIKSQMVQPENVKLSHIYIPFDKDTTKDAANKQTMQSVANQLKAGTLTFEQAVTQYSQDEDSKNQDGDIGWLTTTNTDAETALGSDFMNAAFDTEVGKTSDLVVSNEGYHILKINAHNDAKLLALTDKTGPDTNQTVHDYISAQLQYQKQQENYTKAVNDLLDQLNKQATIKILYK